MKTQNTKTSLHTSIVAMLLCFAMLLGTTFAWFTDAVQSSGNKIVAGSLKIDLELLDKETNQWNSIKNDSTPIFSYTQWEPGFVDVKLLKVENEGSLALKWKAVFVSQKGLSKLADVIDVYVLPYGVLSDADASTQVAYPTDRALAGYTRVGTLAEFVATIEATTYGSLNEGESAYLGIALKMQETAGNEYQGLDLGTFDIQIVATQQTGEHDSFGDNYDEGALFPLVPGQYFFATSSVEVDANGIVSADQKIGDDNGKATAIVPQGVKMVAGANTASLNIKVVSDYEAVLNAKGGDVVYPLDIHVENVSSDNTVPVKITLKEMFPTNYANYNIHLVHVEDGVSVDMVPVDSMGELDAHNEFYYDPATGTVTVAMATFSEVTAAVAAGDPWDGETIDTSWYNTTDTVFTLEDAADFAGFAQIVGGMANGIDIDDFSGKTVKLAADINLGGDDGVIFYPVGYHNSTGSYEHISGGEVTSDVSSFEGAFDGQGHTIFNIYQNTWDMFGDYNSGYSGTPNYYKDGMGIFGFVYNGTVKNLIVDEFESDGEFCTTGCVAAYASGTSTFEDITVVNSNPRAYNVPNGGVVGYAYAEDGATNVINFNNINVDNSNKITALWGSWDVGCGGVLGRVNGATTVNMTNCNVGAVIDVYNDVCGNYQYYQYRYAGMLIGTVGGDSDPLSGDEKINFSNVKVYIGDWADYYYCEFEKNSQGSYTDDFQFSRVERNEIVFDENNMPVSCEHDHTANEDKLALYLPFNQLYTGYGWGASPKSAHDGVEVIQYFYMITYLDADGSLIDVEYVTEGQSDETHNVANEKTITKTHSVSGKTFGGWVDSYSTAIETIKAGNRKDFVLFATYKNQYTARWIDENGNVIASQTVTEGTKVNELQEVAGPESATPEILTFSHWEVQDSEGKFVKQEDCTDRINSDVTLHASYSISNASANGEGSIAIVTGPDADGDGKPDYYTVEAATGLSGDVVIPGEINGVPVTVITDLSEDFINDSVTSVTIKDGVQEIKSEAFAMTSALKEVTIPASMTSIGSNAFANALGGGLGDILGSGKVVAIHYAGTWEQWLEICDDGWDSGLAKGSTVICEDGTYEKTGRAWNSGTNQWEKQ